MKALKIILICVVFAAIGWFGSQFGPSEKRAEAMVFEKIFSFTEAMPEYMFDENLTSKPRKVMVNGFTTYLTVGKTEDDIAKILDFYGKQYKTQPISRISQPLMDQMKDEETREKARKHNKMLKTLEQFQQLNFQKEDYGFWATFQFKDSSLELGSEKFLNQYAKAFESGRLGEIGTARIVLAMKDRDTGKTKVINIWSHRDFNINNLEPDASGDMPGKDMEGVPRYPGSKRLQSVQQENSATMDSLAMYEGGGTIGAQMAFYRSRMPASGWSASPIFQRALGENKVENSLFYTKKGKECTLLFSEDNQGGNIVSTVIIREGKKTKRKGKTEFHKE